MTILILEAPNKESGTCVFPFYYEGNKYTNCAQPDFKTKSINGLGWCSYDSVYKGNWGFCTDACPSGTCQVTSLDCPLTDKGHKKGPVANGTCVFPFKHNGIENFMCKDPKDYAGVGWCSLDSEYEGRWGYCSSNCPKDYDDPCKEIVCNIAGEKCVNGQCKCGSACSCEFNPAGQSCNPDKSICK